MNHLLHQLRKRMSVKYELSLFGESYAWHRSSASGRVALCTIIVQQSHNSEESEAIRYVALGLDRRYWTYHTSDTESGTPGMATPEIGQSCINFPWGKEAYNNTTSNLTQFPLIFLVASYFSISSFPQYFRDSQPAPSVIGCHRCLNINLVHNIFLKNIETAL